MRDRLLPAALGFLILALSSAAVAAPQILGVAAAEEPQPLQCQGATCVADIATFCMQPSRPVPAPGASYRAAGDGFRVIFEDAEGHRHSRPVGGVKIAKLRGYTSATLAITAGLGADEGLRPVAILIGRRSVLVPVAAQGDPDPIREGEVANALAELRPIAEHIFAEHIEKLQATTLINRIVNATPTQGRMTAEQRQELWDSAVGKNPLAGSEAGERAKNVLGFCQGRGANQFFSIRQCLENRLDGMMMDLNSKYWKAIQPGS